MYVGRLVAIGRTRQGRPAALYRVSSRSFPNRTARVLTDAVAIVPKPGHEQMLAENPYVSYRCLRLTGAYAVATNGSHTDPIAEKLAGGMAVRDALVLTLLTLDYEKDSYQTPRIAAVIGLGASSGWLGIVRRDGLTVQELAVAPGQAFYVATYEKTDVTVHQTSDFDATDAAAGARFLVSSGAFAQMTHAVTSVCALETDGRFQLAALDV